MKKNSALLFAAIPILSVSLAFGALFDTMAKRNAMGKLLVKEKAKIKR